MPSVIHSRPRTIEGRHGVSSVASRGIDLVTEILVPQLLLNRTRWHAGCFPARRTRLPNAMEKYMLADGIGRTCHRKSSAILRDCLRARQPRDPQDSASTSFSTSAASIFASAKDVECSVRRSCVPLTNGRTKNGPAILIVRMPRPYSVLPSFQRL
jgi:hypothetical protein